MEEVVNHETADGVLPDISSILAAAEIRQSITFYTQLLEYLRTAQIVASFEADEKDVEFAYTARSPEAEKFLSDNQKGS